MPLWGIKSIRKGPPPKPAAFHSLLQLLGGFSTWTRTAVPKAQAGYQLISNRSLQSKRQSQEVWLRRQLINHWHFEFGRD